MFIRLWLMFLMIWGMGILFLILVALSDAVFRNTGTLLLMRRLGIILLWPVSLLSAAGRSRLLSLFEKTQGDKK